MERKKSMKKNKGFTLVELLAVIVVLAIILIIAVPQITNTINSAKQGSLRSSAMMIASQAEREYTVRQTLGTAIGTIACTDVATLSTTDYNTTTCSITFDGSGNATVKLCGKASGKFDNMCVCDATRTSGTVTSASSC